MELPALSSIPTYQGVGLPNKSGRGAPFQKLLGDEHDAITAEILSKITVKQFKTNFAFDLGFAMTPFPFQARFWTFALLSEMWK